MNTVENKKTIMRLTGMSESRYNELQFEVGMAFLEHECFYDAASVKMMSGTKLYWQWFKNVYAQRDEMWLHQGDTGNAIPREHSRELAYKSYTGWQSVENINVYPNRFIYEEAYCRIQEGQKTEDGSRK